MSKQEKPLKNKVEQHLQLHALGCTTEELLDKFQEYPSEEVKSVLDEFQENGAAIHVSGTWRWTGR